MKELARAKVNDAVDEEILHLTKKKSLIPTGPSTKKGRIYESFN